MPDDIDRGAPPAHPVREAWHGQNKSAVKRAADEWSEEFARVYLRAVTGFARRQPELTAEEAERFRQEFEESHSWIRSAELDDLLIDQLADAERQIRETERGHRYPIPQLKVTITDRERLAFAVDNARDPIDVTCPSFRGAGHRHGQGGQHDAKRDRELVRPLGRGV
jgi:hypothetical protein